MSVEDAGGDKHIAASPAGGRQGWLQSVRTRVATVVAKKAEKRTGRQRAGKGWDEVKKPWLIILQTLKMSVVMLSLLRQAIRLVVIFAVPAESWLTVLAAALTANVRGNGTNQALRGDYD